MRDLSFFLFKNSLGAKMKKGFRSSCSGDGSTSTLNQHNLTPSPEKPPTTLEEMILQLEFEEEMARRAKEHELNNVEQHGRMSCVNNSDILRSARNALSQYPRFSLDGRDAMYRSSFQNLDGYMAGRRSVCCDHRLEQRLLYETRYNHLGGCGSSKTEKNVMCLPSTLGGETVVWCKPGVVAKLMGLEAMPVPVLNSKVDGTHQQILTMKRQNLRRRAARHEMERRLALDRDMDMDTNNCNGPDGSRMMRRKMASRSKAGYCVVKPVAETADGVGGWPMGRFR